MFGSDNRPLAVVTGGWNGILKNKAMAAVADALPGPVGAQMHRGLSEPGSGKQD